MKIILFFTIFACGFAQEKSLHDSKNNSLLAADVKKLPSAEENHVPNPEDDDHNCANVKEILGELSAERANNRDLNQTISDILERMEEMEKNIMRNEEKIIDNQSSVFLLTRDVDDLTEEVDGVQVAVAAVQGDVAVVQDGVIAVAEDVERNTADITTLAVMGHWCAAQHDWTTLGTINYDSLTFSASKNMNIDTTPLDITTGIFTVPVSGAWRMSFSLQSHVYSGELNYCYLYINGDQLDETRHYTFSSSDQVDSTGGRDVTLEASAGDKIEIRADVMGGDFYRIIFCAEYLTKM